MIEFKKLWFIPTLEILSSTVPPIATSTATIEARETERIFTDFEQSVTSVLEKTSVKSYKTMGCCFQYAAVSRTKDQLWRTTRAIVRLWHDNDLWQSLLRVSESLRSPDNIDEYQLRVNLGRLVGEIPGLLSAYRNNDLPLGERSLYHTYFYAKDILRLSRQLNDAHGCGKDLLQTIRDRQDDRARRDDPFLTTGYISPLEFGELLNSLINDNYN